VEVTSDATLIGIVSSYGPEQQRPSGYTTLETILPAWAFEGEVDALAGRLRDPETRERFKHFRKPKFRQILFDQWDAIYLFECKANRDLINKSFAQIAALRQVDPYDVAFDLMLEDAEATGDVTVFMVGKTTTIENVRKAAIWPASCIISDSFSVSPKGLTGQVNVQPNAYGNYPCLISKFVYQEGWLRLEEAIRKCTSLPAQIIGLKDRGMLRKGVWADIVVFDPESLSDRATYEEPKRFPDGIKWVVVNGEIVISNGKQTDALPGMVLRRA